MYLAGRQINSHVPGDHNLRSGCGAHGGPPGDHLQPGDQLADARRLDEVVVGPGVQTAHDRALVVACGEDHHGDGADPAELPQHLQPVHIRQAEVQDDDVVTAVCEQDVGPAPLESGLVPAGLERLDQRLPDTLIVFDHREPHMPILANRRVHAQLLVATAARRAAAGSLTFP